MQVKAKLKFIRISPKKVRLVAGLIRGLDVEEAIVQLQFSKKNASLSLGKLLKSAIANAEENNELKRDNLFIKEVLVEEGPTLKRWMPKAMGRATPIRKRASHITVTLEEKIPTIKKEKIKKESLNDDIIKIEDLGKISQEDSKSNKKDSKKTEKKETASGSKGEKRINKIFNRTGNK